MMMMMIFWKDQAPLPRLKQPSRHHHRYCYRASRDYEIIKGLAGPTCARGYDYCDGCVAEEHHRSY